MQVKVFLSPNNDSIDIPNGNLLSFEKVMIVWSFCSQDLNSSTRELGTTILISEIFICFGIFFFHSKRLL